MPANKDHARRRRAAKPKPPPRRTCRWLHGRPLDEFAAGMCVGLLVEFGREIDRYDVEFLGDRWVVRKVSQDNELHEYTLPADLSACNCPASHWRPYDECRHRASLRAALLAAAAKEKQNC